MRPIYFTFSTATLSQTATNSFQTAGHSLVDPRTVTQNNTLPNNVRIPYTAAHSLETTHIKTLRNTSIVIKMHWRLYRRFNTKQNSTFIIMTTTNLLIKKTFIVKTKVSLPSFCLLFFLGNRLSQTSRGSYYYDYHTHTHTHTCARAQIQSAANTGISFSRANTQTLNSSRTFLNFWSFTTTAHQITKNISKYNC